MRCKSCNERLNDVELSRTYIDGEHVDMCTSCFRASGYEGATMVNPKFVKQIDPEEDLWDSWEDFEE